MLIEVIGTKPEISKNAKNHLGKYKASCLVSSGPTNILVNVGDDILQRMNITKLKALTHILITHAHLQAVSGIDILDKVLEESNRVVQLYASHEVLKILRLRYKLSNFQCNKIHTGKLFNIGGIFVKAINVFHAPDYPTFAYNFNGVFLYASDMGPMVSKKDIKYMQNNILSIIDGQYWNYQVISDNHITVLNHLSYILDLNNKYTLFTGMGNQWPNLKKSNKVITLRLRDYKKINKTCTIREVRTAREGEKISINIRKLIERRKVRNKKIDI